MKSSDRTMYRSIFCPTKGDVLKCSVAFHRGSNSMGKPTKRFSNDKDFQRMEKFLREKFFPGSEERWDKKTIDQKIILAIYLTCQYLANCDGHDQDIRGMKALFYASTESTVHVRNGLRFPFLFPFCLALLEQDMGSGSVSVVYETYGTKCRASVNISDPASITGAAQELFGMNKTLSTGYLWRFARLVNSQQYCSQPHLVVGYGCNFRVSDEENRFQYAVVNTESLPDRNPSDETKKSRESATELEYPYLDPTLESEIQLNPVGTDEEGIGEDLEVDEKVEEEEEEELESDDIECDAETTTASTCTPASALLKASKAVHYSVLGRTLPLSLQPSTHTVNGVRYQQYSVNLRQAFGEYNQAVQMTALSSDFKLCEVYSGLDYEVNFGMYYDRVKKFFKLVQANMMSLKEDGNITRLEVAMSTDANNIEQEVISQLTNSFSLCRDNVTVYDVSDIADIAEFFAQALLFRAFVATALVGIKSIHVTESDMAVFRVIPELNAYIRNFYSGRNSGGDRDIYGKKLGKYCRRPILKPLSHDPTDTLLKVGLQNVDSFWQRFLEVLNVPLSKDNQRFGSFQLTDSDIRSIVICEHCLRIFSSDDPQAMAHPCMSARNSDHQNQPLHSPMSTAITRKVSDWGQRLTEPQLRFVDDMMTAIRSHHVYNVHLMGVAGSGKSFTAQVLLQRLLNWYHGKAKVVLLSPTTNPAGIFNGVPIGAFFGLSPETNIDFNTHTSFENFFNQWYSDSLENFHWKRKVVEPILSAETMIIDDCNLLSARGLENIDFMLRCIKRSKQPFAGVRMILVGDPLQLSASFPEEDRLLRRYFQSSKFTDFESKFIVYYFKDSLRQEDGEFLELLNKIRIGDIGEPDLRRINSWGSDIPREAIEFVNDADQPSSQIESVSLVSPSLYYCQEIFNESFFNNGEGVRSINSTESNGNILVIFADQLELARVTVALDHSKRARSPSFRAEQFPTITSNLLIDCESGMSIGREQLPLHLRLATLDAIVGVNFRRDRTVVVYNRKLQQAGSIYTALSRANLQQQIATALPLRREDIVVDPVAEEFDEYHRQSFQTRVRYYYDSSSGKRKDKRSYL